MPDRIDQLERLMRLRASGTLTEAEFEIEKAQLLVRDHNGHSSAVSPPKEKLKRNWLLISSVGLLSMIGIGVAIAQITDNHEAQATTGVAIADQGGADPKPLDANSSDHQSLRGLPLDRQYELAVKAVFGGGAHEIRTKDGISYRYEKGKLIWSSHAPILILPGVHNDTSPVASGTLGVFYLREKGGVFEMYKRWPDAIGGSMMGNPPEWRVSDEVSDFPVVISTAGGVWQGYSCGATLLTELVPSGPSDLAGFDSEYSNGGAAQEGDKQDTIDGEIANIVKNKSFEVRFTGTQTFTHQYIRKGRTYARKPGDTPIEIPKC